MARGTLILFVILGTVGAAQATPYTLDNVQVDVDYWAGTGTNETIVVIDWNNTGGPYVTESHAFGYRWDGDAFVTDALAAIDAGGALDLAFGYGGGFVNDAFYNDDLDSHDSSSFSGWWCGGQSTDGITWTLNGGGLNTEALVDGNLEGLNIDSGNWTLDTITVPTPEPASALLLAVALPFIRRRRNG